jgi:hypothetical protein
MSRPRSHNVMTAYILVNGTSTDIVSLSSFLDSIQIVFNKTVNIHVYINVTLRRVRVTIVVVEEQ